MSLDLALDEEDEEEVRPVDAKATVFLVWPAGAAIGVRDVVSMVGVLETILYTATNHNNT